MITNPTDRILRSGAQVLCDAAGNITITAASTRSVSINGTGGSFLIASLPGGGVAALAISSAGLVLLQSATGQSATLQSNGGSCAINGSGSVAITSNTGQDIVITAAAGRIVQIGPQLNVTIVKYLTTSVGAGLAALGANCPAVTLTAPFAWVQAQASDGSTIWIPGWK